MIKLSKVMALEDVNEEARKDARSFVLGVEQSFNKEIHKIAEYIKHYGKKIVLIAGPSSSGKTTSSFVLQKELETLGISSHVLSMDNFFFDEDKIPLRKDGNHDIESIYALDVESIRNCLKEILEKGKTKTPQFDFINHVRKKTWKPFELEEKGVFIMEGIHGLNPKIVEGLDLTHIFKLYLNCETSFSFKGKVVLAADDLRFLRRVIRDVHDRNVPPMKTLEMWPEVQKGERVYIRPYKKTANYKLNTVHLYEPLVYKDIFLDKLKEITRKKGFKVYRKLFKFCERIKRNLVPKESIIREFIGKS